MTETWRYDEVETRRDFPWPPAEGGSILTALADTWKGATLDAGRFFARLPRQGGTGAAILYYLGIGILVAGASLFWDTVADTLSTGQEVVAEEGQGFQPAVVFLLSPLILLVGLVMSAGATHLVLLVVRGASGGLDTTVRTFCYAYSPMIFGVVPILGTLLGVLWMLVVAIVGLAAAHQAPRWKPAVAVLLPFLLLVAAFVFAVLAVLATGAAPI